MKTIKKLTLWFLLANLLYTPSCTAKAAKPTIVWEEYISYRSATLIACAFIYSFSYQPQDKTTQASIKNTKIDVLKYKEETEREKKQIEQQQNKVEREKEREQNRIEQDRKRIESDREREQQRLKLEQQRIARDQEQIELLKKAILVYHPSLNASYFNNPLQKMANQTQRTIIAINEQQLKKGPAFIEIFFNQAKELGLCIIYIEKDKKIDYEYQLKYPDFFHNYDTNDNLSDDCIHEYIQQIKSLEQTNRSCIILGTTKNKICHASVNDICDLGCNIEQDNPGYYERVEFLNILLKTQSHCISVHNLAKKTIGLSYMQLITLVEEAALHAKRNKKNTIPSIYFDKAYNKTVATYNIQVRDQKALQKTAVHEMGHAFIAALFQQNFTVQKVSITPRYKFRKPSMFYGDTYQSIENGRASTTVHYYRKDAVEVNKKHIMICLAGKIAEQLCLGLEYGKFLNHDTGYDDFIYNPDGAYYDLKQAREIADKIIHEMQEQNENIPTQNDLIYELYKETFELMLSYKQKLQKGAQLLEQEEFLSGTQVYNLLNEA